MRVWLLLLILVLVPVALGQQEAEDLFASETVGVDLTVSSALSITPKQSGAMSLDYVQADLFFFPKEDRAQRVLSLTTDPQAEPRENALRFFWERPQAETLRYEARGQVEVRNQFGHVTKKIPFPLTSIPPEARPYLEPSEHIDSADPDIVTMANRLAQGKDDLFVVVSDIAIWTKSTVAYNLSTLTAEVSQKASWVLENKQGVCDELTSLFIAMLRALGIPARFVTGVSYTASPLFPERWGAHGWAEVYFPDIGWIPFDPTFGEYGWVDPGHVKMMVSKDPTEPSTRFEWRGTNADLKFKEPDIDAAITAVGERLPPVVALSIKPLYDETGFGAYNLAQATVENLQPYYLTTELKLARVTELEVLEPYNQPVILKPREKKTIFWRIRVVPGLQEQYVYTLPLGVFTVQNDSARASFTARTQGGQHTKVEVTRAMNLLAEEEEQVVSHTLDISCAPDTTALMPDTAATITCALHNLGTTPLKAVRACLDDTQCQALDIGIGQTRSLSFTQKFTVPGATTVFVRASNAELSKSIALAFMMNDIPSVNITDVDYPATVRYDQQFTLTFLLKPVSHTMPKDVRVLVKTPVRSYRFEMPELPGEHVFDVEMSANDLSLGMTDIMIDAQYEDNRGKEYHTTATAPITLNDVPFLAKLWLWFRGWFA